MSVHWHFYRNIFLNEDPGKNRLSLVQTHLHVIGYFENHKLPPNLSESVSTVCIFIGFYRAVDALVYFVDLAHWPNTWDGTLEKHRDYLFRL